MLGVFFSSTLWVGLSLCKFSCLLHKMNDSGGYVEFAALLITLNMYYSYDPRTQEAKNQIK